MDKKRNKVSEAAELNQKTGDVKKTGIMLEALEDYMDKLSPWERDEFIPSVTDRFYNFNKPLTKRQFEVLENIYRRYF